MFKAPFSFAGRIRRLEYGISHLIYFLANLLLTYLTETYDPNFILSTNPVTVLINFLIHADDNLVLMIGIALYIPLLWFIIAQGAKRCHDVGNSGWFQLIPFYVLVQLFREGSPSKNRFGRNPKLPEEEEVIENEFWEKGPLPKQ